MIPITLLNKAMVVGEVFVGGSEVAVEEEDVDSGVVEGEALGEVVVVGGEGEEDSNPIKEMALLF